MPEKARRLPDSELEIMLAIWKIGRPATRPEIAAVLHEKGWAAATLNSFLSRLVEKGFLSCEKGGMGQGKVYTYTAIIHKDDYLKSESKSFMERFYGSSIKKFVTAFCQNEKLTAQEIEEIQALLDGLKRGHPGD